MLVRNSRRVQCRARARGPCCPCTGRGRRRTRTAVPEYAHRFKNTFACARHCRRNFKNAARAAAAAGRRAELAHPASMWNPRRLHVSPCQQLEAAVLPDPASEVVPAVAVEVSVLAPVAGSGAGVLCDVPPAVALAGPWAPLAHGRLAYAPLAAGSRAHRPAARCPLPIYPHRATAPRATPRALSKKYLDDTPATRASLPYNLLAVQKKIARQGVSSSSSRSRVWP